MKHNRNTIIGLPFLLLALLTGCGDDSLGNAHLQQRGPSGPGTLEDFEQEELSPQTEGTALSLVDQRKIIRSGSVQLEVASVDSAEKLLNRFVQTQQGYISNASRYHTEGKVMQSLMEIRIPAESFDSLIAYTRSVGDVTSEDITSSDVTDSYIDLQARIHTQQQLEQRLLELLAKRNGTLADIVKIEEKLASVRREIERAQGELRHMQNQVAMSTLSVTMVEPGAVNTNNGETVGGAIQQAVKESIEALVEITVILLRLVIIMLPLSLLAWIIYRLLKVLYKQKKHHLTPTPRE